MTTGSSAGATTGSSAGSWEEKASVLVGAGARAPGGSPLGNVSGVKVRAPVGEPTGVLVGTEVRVPGGGLVGVVAGAKVGQPVGEPTSVFVGAGARAPGGGPASVVAGAEEVGASADVFEGAGVRVLVRAADSA